MIVYLYNIPEAQQGPSVECGPAQGPGPMQDTESTPATGSEAGPGPCRNAGNSLL